MYHLQNAVEHLPLEHHLSQAGVLRMSSLGSAAPPQAHTFPWWLLGWAPSQTPAPALVAFTPCLLQDLLVQGGTGHMLNSCPSRKAEMHLNSDLGRAPELSSSHVFPTSVGQL